MKPTGDRVLIRPEAVEKKTASGLFIPVVDAVSDKGEVIATGPGRKTSEGVLISMQVKVGDRVMWSAGSGTKVKVHNEEFVVMSEDLILGVLSD